MITPFKVFSGFIVIIISFSLLGNDGYKLWLDFKPLEQGSIKSAYNEMIFSISSNSDDEIIQTAIHEVQSGFHKLIGKKLTHTEILNEGDLQFILLSNEVDYGFNTSEITAEGFSLRINKEGKIQLFAKDSNGLLYGAFHLLKQIQLGTPIQQIETIENPKIKLRILNHWDNLDRTVERGYAGFSIWNWHQLPEYIDQRYVDYARANASIGINGTVVTNVNSNSLVFRKDYLQKAAALADIFRPYGIKLYLTARFSSPRELGGLETADPLDPEVIKWWKEKVDEIYEYIPDFGGFLVKANSEGQPGPQEYGRNHAEGSNLLADALTPHGGIVMWRAFVYSNEEPVDRAKQAYNEFVPLDGKFRDNVLIQVKNGPIDFQPREPIHPLFGNLSETPVMMEFQITKEYLGQGTHLVGLSNMYEEVLDTDTYVKGEGSTVAKIIDGTIHGNKLTGIAGVSNIGTARNWTGNLFAQADWYAFGKLAWDPYTDSDSIFEEWVKRTFGKNEKVIEVASAMLDKSYEYCVKYMTPLGLHHIMAAGHHYGPGPWVSGMPRADWTSVYYHKGDENGIGFDRTESGSNALEQYSPELKIQYENPKTISLKYLLWFHHLPWDYLLPTGRNLWDEICIQYQQGVEGVTHMKNDWMTLKGLIDNERYNHVLMHLEIQEKEAIWWRNACIAYFSQFSKMEVPAGVPSPPKDLDYYESISYPYAPGIRPRW